MQSRASRGGWVAGCLALVLLAGAACSSFHDAAGPNDAGVDGASPDASPACAVPASPVTTRECKGCRALGAFTMQPVAAAVVAGPGTIDAMIGDELHEAAAGAATLTRLPDVLPVRGVARELGIDDAWIYVSTSERIVRVRRTPAAPGSNRTTEQLVGDDGPPPPASMYVGDTVLFLATESGVTILGKERDAGSSTIPVKVAAFAAAGDRGFYIADEPSGTSSINEYGSTSAHGRITGKVRALAIAEGYFYVASDKGTRTAISRIAVDAPNDAVPEILVDEPGLVELLRADRGRLYWTASRGAGNRVLASSDLCGGEAADLASELGIAPYHALLFDGDAVYVAGSSTGTILRAPRK